jgi:hypothetical protein
VEPLRDAAREAITRAAPLFELVGRQTRLLDALAWPREVEERFFEQGEQALPEPVYEVDRTCKTRCSGGSPPSAGRTPTATG